jgi:hypothetical protein
MTIETGPNRQRIVAEHIHATISTMSMAGMGLMGLVAGASTAGALGMVRLVADTWFPWMTAHSEQKHQLNANLYAQRADAVARWRAGLAGARDDYRQWAAGPRDHDPPNVVGDEWFEGLRPHLPDTGETAKYATRTKSVATTRQSYCCRWRSAESKSSGWTKPRATHVGRETSPRRVTRPAHFADPAGRG